jgi:hypothetical protein
VVLNNLREGVLTSDIYEPTLNPLYCDVLQHYGVLAWPCRVGAPDRKGKVESAVGHTQATPLKVPVVPRRSICAADEVAPANDGRTPLITAIGLARLVRVGPTGGYWSTIFPAVIVFGLGLSITVAPLTATVLAAAGPEHAGVSPAINNDVARASGLIAVATLPLVAGITGRAAALDPYIFSAGFGMAMWITTTLVAAGGVLSSLTIRDIPAARDVSATSAPDRASHVSCPLDAPPLRPMQRG